MFEIQLKGYEALRDQLDSRIVDKAARQAIQKAARDGRATASAEIFRRWNIKKSDINAVVSAVRVSGQDGKMAIRAVGRPRSLAYFGAKEFRAHRVTSRTRSQLRKRNTGKSGVFAQILRGGETLHKPNAFIAAMRSGHVGVFERIPGSRMASNRHKEKIVERSVITMASMFGQTPVWEPTRQRVMNTLEVEFPRLIDVLFRR